MTDYRTKIKLGDEYTDERTGIKGFANILVFNENGCVEVDLEWADTSEGSVKVRRQMFNELRLTRVDGAEDTEQVYTSDVTLGRQYSDVQTGLTGWACAIEFFERIATTVVIRSLLTEPKTGEAKELKMHVVDDFLLQDVETQKQARRRSDAPSPVRPGALA